MVELSSIYHQTHDRRIKRPRFIYCVCNQVSVEQLFILLFIFVNQVHLLPDYSGMQRGVVMGANAPPARKFDFYF